MSAAMHASLCAALYTIVKWATLAFYHRQSSVIIGQLPLLHVFRLYVHVHNSAPDHRPYTWP
jgi:hypothetical protein